MNHDADHLRVPSDDELSDEARDLLAKFPTARGETLALFRMLGDAPRVMQRVLLGGLLDRASPLTLRERELVIWRVCARCNWTSLALGSL